MKILILDDDASLAKAVKAMLDQYDHDIDCSEDAQEAVRLVEVGDYDFVLADYKMPGKDGIWFMKNVKLPKKTKVLLSTAYANRQVINEMFALGASGYLIKPFDEEDLLRHLDFHAK